MNVSMFLLKLQILEIFLHFRKLTVKNLNSIFSFFLCFPELRFQEEPQFLPRSARQTSPPSSISLHIEYELRS